MAFGMPSPVAHLTNSFGPALLAFMTKLKSCIETFPAPRPLPYAEEPVCEHPKPNEMHSISSLCFSSMDSPGAPSTFRK